MQVHLHRQSRLKALIGGEIVLLSGLMLILALSEPAQRPFKDAAILFEERWHRWQTERWWRVHRARDPLPGKPIHLVASLNNGAPAFEVLALGDADASTLHLADRYLSKRLSRSGTAPVVLIMLGSQEAVQRVSEQLRRHKVPIYSDSSGALHEQLNAFFVPRWYLFLRDGTLIRKQETTQLVLECGCQSKEVR